MASVDYLAGVFEGLWYAVSGRKPVLEKDAGVRWRGEPEKGQPARTVSDPDRSLARTFGNDMGVNVEVISAVIEK